MVLCDHQSCAFEKRAWLPLHSSRGSDVTLHPWCEKCGLVKNISDDRPYKIGYWMNVLTRLAHFLRLTQCQKRLIAKELESYEWFTDMYGITGSTQKALFIEIIKKYCAINLNTIDSFLC